MMFELLRSKIRGSPLLFELVCSKIKGSPIMFEQQIDKLEANFEEHIEMHNGPGFA